MILKVKELPDIIEQGSTLEITTSDVNYYTHGFFKYPCKFIPHIPRWAILKYTKKGDDVLDPFAGSGTTLVEAVLNRRNGLAVDFDKLSQLLCRSKTSRLTKNQVSLINEYRKKLFTRDESIKQGSGLPDLHNTNHWFPERNITDLQILKRNIENLYRETQDEEIYYFLQVCLASIIRKVSFADDMSPKPYVSRRIKKEPHLVKPVFLKTLDTYLSRMESYDVSKLGKYKLIAEDARNINSPEYLNKIPLAVTSPPYINAFDYVRSLRLENAWLGFYGDTNIINIKKMQVGTENISVKEYGGGVKPTKIASLDNVLQEIIKKDKKRAYIVYKYFMDMNKNFSEVHKLLKPGGHYVVVVGNSKIRGVEVPTKDILMAFAENLGYKVRNDFSYVIKNRYLRIPRSGLGGYMDVDWVIDLEK